MRKENNKTLADLRFQTEPKFLWTGAFLPMVDSTVESRFADDRTYTWQGKKVDEQTHLGFDLAKLAHSPIPASNDGKVVWAEDLGIYGNCVVIDHGFGLQSFYGHMSEFLVKKGDMVKKGQIIGKTGSTGLAGGDHLHFGDAGGWRAGECGRVVGSALGEGPHPEQAGAGDGRRGCGRLCGGGEGAPAGAAEEEVGGVGRVGCSSRAPERGCCRYRARPRITKLRRARLIG